MALLDLVIFIGIFPLYAALAWILTGWVWDFQHKTPDFYRVRYPKLNRGGPGLTFDSKDEALEWMRTFSGEILPGRRTVLVEVRLWHGREVTAEVKA